MRSFAPLAAAWLALTVSAAGAATFGDPARYCAAVGTIDRPDARYVGPAVPDWIAQSLKQVTNAPAGASLDVFKRAVWRCEGGQVLACSFGANIPCNAKADVSRKPGPGASTFCRENPGSDVVPAVATGHATIYEWRCAGTRPVVARQVLAVDRRGFPTEFWHEVSRPAGSD